MVAKGMGRARAAKPRKTNRLGNRLLDARRDRLDLRDRVYTPRVHSLPDQHPDDAVLAKHLPNYIKAELVRDQGDDGACTGFGLTCVVNYLLWRKAECPAKFESVSPRMIYHLARMYDEWPGEDYDGSSCRGALKGWHKHGICSETLWPYGTGKQTFIAPTEPWADDALTRQLGIYYRIDKNSIVDMQAAIYEVGAIYVSSDVHEGWMLDTTDEGPSFANLPVIARQGQRPDGGHAFALVGYNRTGFVVQNSWGASWGLKGFAILPYEDWVDLGSDAWVCALGVPKTIAGALSEPARGARPPAQNQQPPRVMVRTSQRLRVASAVGVTVARAPGVAAERLSVDDAYRRTLVLGNNGEVERRVIEHRDVEDTIDRLCRVLPEDWVKARAARGAERLMLYAHGGLNSESASIARIRVLGKLFEDNGIYPLFLTWKTGVQESIAGSIEDRLADLMTPARGLRETLADIRDSIIDAKDRALEVAAGAVMGRSIWNEMKQNAEAAAMPGRGGWLMAQALAKLVAARGGKLQIHIVGHSAGAILLGHLLEHLPTVSSCTLFAPACNVAFANRTYVAAAAAGKLTGELRVHVLDDARELEDSVGPYGKSLLYLVSRALERDYKTPILGLANCFDSEFNRSPQWNDETPRIEKEIQEQLETWQAFWRSRAGGVMKRLAIENARTVPTGKVREAPMIPATHGCFDNHAGVIDATVAAVLGRAKPLRAADNLNY